MNRHTIGFGAFFFSLLIAPELPLAGLGLGASESNLSAGALGLALWFLLSVGPFGFRNTYNLGPILVLVFCGCFFLVVSLFSMTLTSIVYALQYFYYLFLCCLLIPAFLDDRIQQQKFATVCRVLSWLGLIYIAGLLVSLWTGPLYPHQVGAYAKRYGELEITRAVGFSSSVSLGGGIATFLAAFFLFLYPSQGRRFGTLFAVAGLLGVFASLSRSAIMAFSSALLALAGLHILRFATVHGSKLSNSPFVLRLALMFLLMGLACTSYLALDDDMRQTMLQAARGLGLDQAIAEKDVDDRARLWERGIHQWLDKPPWQLAFGVGFRNSSTVRGGAFGTAHNLYIEMLNDFGMLGLGLFLAPILTVLGRLCVRIIACGGDPITHFCFVASTSLVVHNLSQVFFYHPSMVALLVFLIALASLHLRCGDPRLRSRSAPRSSPAPPDTPRVERR